MRRRKREKKSKTQFKHASRRCRERFGFSPTQQDFLNWIAKIKRGEAVFVSKQSNRVSIFDLNHEEHELRLVYDKVRKTICSILTRDMDVTLYEQNIL